MAATASPATLVRVARGERRLWPLAAGLPLAALAAASVLAGGGSRDGMVAWVGVVALGVCALAGALVLAGRLPVPGVTRAGGLALACLAGFVAWNGLTVFWSVDPARSFAYFDRGVTYLAILCVAIATAAVVPRATSAFAWSMAALVAIVVAWALAGKVAPGLFEDGARFARLREPVGFWNALGAVLAIGTPAALWAAAGRRHDPRARAGAVVLLFLLAVALALTLSRSGIALGALGALAWIVLAPRRHASVAAVLIAAPPAAAVSAWALGAPGISGDFVDEAVRVADGRTLGLVLAGAGLVVGLVAYVAARWEGRPGVLDRHERRLRHAATAVLVLGAIAAVAAVGVRSGNPAAWVADKVSEFASSDTIDSSAARVGSASLNSRVPWWNEAIQGFRWSPLGGTGAGTWELTHRRLRTIWQDVTEPHMLPLQFLSETGLVGAGLFVGALAAGGVAVARGRRRLEDPERPAALALALGLGVWVVHGLVDVDWDFLAVNALPLAAAGVLLGAPSSPVRVRRAALVPLPVAGCVLAACALLAPQVAGHRVEKSAAALERGEPAAALAHAIAAEQANSFSLAPLRAQAEARYALGDLDGVQAIYVEAVRRQPDNPATWLELGLFQLEVAARPELAVRLLEQAWRLDPRGSLDPARDGESALELARRLAGLPPLIVTPPG